MMSSNLPDVQTDDNGLIIPKKLINPCLESTDRKQLHRELKFNTKMGINVLNQKNELQRAYEKQREKQQLQQQRREQSELQSDQQSGGMQLTNELNRVMQERAQKLQHEQNQQQEEDDKLAFVNPEYLKVRAKLKTSLKTYNK